MTSWLVRKRRVIIRQKEAVKEVVWNHFRLVIVRELEDVPEDLEKQLFNAVRRAIEN